MSQLHPLAWLFLPTLWWCGRLRRTGRLHVAAPTLAVPRKPNSPFTILIPPPFLHRHTTASTPYTPTSGARQCCTSFDHSLGHCTQHSDRSAQACGHCIPHRSLDTDRNGARHDAGANECARAALHAPARSTLDGCAILLPRARHAQVFPGRAAQ